jgi:two-component system phosphate regulon response regulator PhoB
MTCFALDKQFASFSSMATTILLVEPDTTLRKAVTLALENEGYRVLQVSDGRRVLDFLTGSSPNQDIHLLILEAALPQINGFDLCQQLRRQGYNLPILIISSKTSETDRVLGLEIGADDYLVKPFGMRELIARCRALLRQWSRAASDQPAILRYRNLMLDPVSRTVTLRDQPIALSPKEFRLLELLMQYPKRVWVREQLIDRIWGTDYIGDFKTVDVHIRWLREKIEQNPGKPEYIITVRGFGYRLG